MEINCCVFPAPSEYDLGEIINNILLVPKKKNICSQFYHHKYLMNIVSDNNEFLMLVRSRKGKQFSGNNSTSESLCLGHEHKFDVYCGLKQKAERATQNLMRHTNNVMNRKYTHGNIEKVCDEIPCLFLSGTNKDKIIVFFHGNGEDLSTSYYFANYIRNMLDISILVMEYQGYSIYEGSSSSKNVIEDSKIVINFLIQNGFDVSDIILFGRSIGGAIAFQAASNYETSCLILLSPFLSLKKIAEDIYGRCASSLIRDTLDNASLAQTVKCPILIIHGLKDTLVPYHHSISILGQCKGFSRLKLAQNMTHAKFNFKHDFLIPVKTFLSDLSIWKESD